MHPESDESVVLRAAPQLRLFCVFLALLTAGLLINYSSQKSGLEVILFRAWGLLAGVAWLLMGFRERVVVRESAQSIEVFTFFRRLPLPMADIERIVQPPRGRAVLILRSGARSPFEWRRAAGVPVVLSRGGPDYSLERLADLLGVEITDSFDLK